jgi:DNA polymerase elongation subunit (family B)
VRGFAEWLDNTMPDLMLPPTEGPKILVFDIETTPSLGWFFGNIWKTRILQIKQPWYMLSAAYKWLGTDEIGFFGIWEDANFTPNSTDDRYVVRRLHRLMDQADVVVAHNGDSFDIKMGNTAFQKHGLGAPSPYQSVDTLKEDRRYFRRESHSLKDIAEMLGLSSKLDNSGISLWFKTMEGLKEACMEMMDYNIQDVATLEELYMELREWMGYPGKKAGPNMGHWHSGEEPVCPNCGHDRLWVRQYYRTAFSEFPVYQCHKKSGGCGSYHRSRSRVSQRTNTDKVHLV